MLQDHGGEVWEVHFSYSHLLYLLPSLFSDDGSSLFTLPNTKQDQLDQLVSISGLWEWFSFLFFFTFYWSIVAFQCCVSFYYTAK